MSDSAMLYKLLAKSVGIKYGIIPTFMAKPYAQLPGCSGHMHVSLRDSKSGKNAFAISKEEIAAGGRKDAKYSDVAYVSKEAEHFLAGLMAGLADGELSLDLSCDDAHDLTSCSPLSVMPLLCPTINSYKRLAGGEVRPQFPLPPSSLRVFL